MKIAKIYETIVSLSAAEMFHESGIEATVLGKLRDRYEGRCEKDTLIISIENLVRRSGCRISKSRLDGSGDIHVQFKARSIVYQEGEIITGCEVQKIERNNYIICKHERAVVNLKGSHILQSLRSGQLITVRIAGVAYMNGERAVTIYGVPFSYSYKVPVFTVRAGKISADESEILRQKLGEFAAIDKSRADSELIKFFAELYYPRREAFDQQALKDWQFGNLRELAEQILEAGEVPTELTVSRHPIIEKSQPLVVLGDGEQLAKFGDILYEITPITETAVWVLVQLLEDYLAYWRLLLESATLYAGEKLSAHSNVWDIYRKLKR